MAKIIVGKEDTVLLKDGREVRILKIYSNDNIVHRYDAINDKIEGGGMRFPLGPNEIVKVTETFAQRKERLAKEAKVAK
jgi:hypothetical protein